MIAETKFTVEDFRKRIQAMWLTSCLTKRVALAAEFANPYNFSLWIDR